MTLRSALANLARAVADEAEHNPNFARRVSEALRLGREATGGRSGATPTSANERRARNRRPAAAFDPVVVARDGEDILRARLTELSLEQLKDIVAEFGMDPGKLVLKWKSPEKVIDRIVEISVPRSQKGDAFRAGPQPRRRESMRLKHLNDGYGIDLEGIAFGMLDAQKRPVRCLVTGDALTDAIGGNPTQAEQVDWFLSNRALVEEVASAKFDQGAVESDGTIRVGTRDLNPLLFNT
jgi:hypothetical protein